MRMLKMDGNDAVRVIEAPDPVPGPGEVVVQTAVSVLCGSELHSYHGAGNAKEQRRARGGGDGDPARPGGGPPAGGPEGGAQWCGGLWAM